MVWHVSFAFFGSELGSQLAARDSVCPFALDQKSFFLSWSKVSQTLGGSNRRHAVCCQWVDPLKKAFDTTTFRCDGDRENCFRREITAKMVTIAHTEVPSRNILANSDFSESANLCGIEMSFPNWKYFAVNHQEILVTRGIWNQS